MNLKSVCSSQRFGRGARVAFPAAGPDLGPGTTTKGNTLRGIIGWIIIGGLLGGWLLGVIGMDIAGAGIIASFLTALISAVIQLFVVKAVTMRV